MRSAAEWWAHPRSRGENAELGFQKVGGSGSSPLTRGKPGVDARREHGCGLIPAHAGKTCPAPPVSQPDPAHPRSRGENKRMGIPMCSIRGSSPLTRGKLHASTTCRVGPGLIPAHAGKTAARSSRRSWQRAHPRSRGENRVWGNINCQQAGSSPLTRGKQGM